MIRFVNSYHHYDIRGEIRRIDYQLEDRVYGHDYVLDNSRLFIRSSWKSV